LNRVLTRGCPGGKLAYIKSAGQKVFGRGPPPRIRGEANGANAAFLGSNQTSLFYFCMINLFQVFVIIKQKTMALSDQIKDMAKELEKKGDELKDMARNVEKMSEQIREMEKKQS
jgi:hypothetical protein